MDIAAYSVAQATATAAATASVLVLRKTMDAQTMQAKAVLQMLPPPPSLQGQHIDVYG